MPAQLPAGAPVEVFAECSDWLIVIGGSAMVYYGMDPLRIIQQSGPRNC